MANLGEECLDPGSPSCKEKVIEEVLSREGAIFVILASVFIAGMSAYFYFKYQKALQQQNRLGLTYKFSLPQEKAMFEEMISKRPNEEGSPVYGQWHKGTCAMLLRRAIMDVQIYSQILKDFNRQNQLYKNGIIMENFDDVKTAKATLEQEIALVQREAEALQPGWGAQIFPMAQQKRQQFDMMRKKRELEEKKKQEAEEKKKQKLIEKEREAKRREQLAEQLIREEEQEKRREKSKQNQKK
mmetsp:Transcript_4071/g.5125  ORF Transcript_4071/g.5125 Transcript_4071/m.5125 type:complete len:242 (+) Transcript_4071:503-1228(+)